MSFWRRHTNFNSDYSPNSVYRGGSSPTHMLQARFQQAPITFLIAAINLLVYVANFLYEPLTNYLVIIPALTPSEPYTLITSAFAHAGIYHLIFNMMALISIGLTLEPVFGQIKYLIIYLISLLGANLTIMGISLLSAKNYGFSNLLSGTVGASGAIFGLFGACLAVLLLERLDVTQMVILLVINAALPLLMPGISWEGHLGGFIFGLFSGLLVWKLRWRPRQKQYSWIYLSIFLGLEILFLCLEVIAIKNLLTGLVA